MAGATLALALSHLSDGAMPVTLIEAITQNSQYHPGYDSRAIALAEGTCQQLSGLNIWPHLKSCATAIDEIQVSDRGHGGFVTLKAGDYGVAALGYVVEQHKVGQSLFRLLSEAPGLTICCPDRVKDVKRQDDNVTVTLVQGGAVQGSLLIAADGSCSQVAEACHFTFRQHAYNQVAIIANITTSEPHLGRAFERFTEQGPLALLPMPGQRCALVWCHASRNQQVISSWDNATFVQKLQQNFGWRLGRFSNPGQRVCYPLMLKQATHRISHRVVLAGNAAQTLHPVAGQGFNLAMRDVMTLAETLVSAWRSGEDPGSYAVLARYQQRRESDADITVNLADGLVRLFTNSYSPLVVVRNAGLIAMDHLPLLRHQFVARTLGWVLR